MEVRCSDNKIPLYGPNAGKHGWVWRKFFPIRIGLMGEEVITTDPAELIENAKANGDRRGIYGKVCTGFCGHNPVWEYRTFPVSGIKIKNN